MKKLLSLFVAFVATCTLWASNVITYTANAKLEEATDEDDYGRLHTNAFNVSISSHTFSNGTGTITFAGEVTSIGKDAFWGCSGLTSITIPNSVTSIGNNAFDGCFRLTAVHITDLAAWCGIVFADYYANPLYYAHHLYLNGSEVTNMVIPNSVTSIGDYAFYGCSGLTSITIGNSVTSIGGGAFEGCSGLTSITIPNSVTSIGGSAFDGCSGLTSIAIPNSVTSIGNYAFYYCSGLTSITIPNSVTSIGNYAFYYCSGLTSITIGNSVTSIGGGAFEGCSGLTSITIPNSVRYIEDYVFRGCSGLTSVTIGNSVRSIGGGAFEGCSGLTSITIPNSVTSIGEEAFSECTKLRYITSYAPEPPAISQNTFSNYNVMLKVPCDYLDEYKFHAVWGSFRYIECIGAEESAITTTTVTPSATDATFAWPAAEGASSYTLTITKDGETVCTLTFNANGQLMNIAFAPGRNGAAQAQAAELTATGYQFTVTGLEEGVTYAYTLVAKDAGKNTISTQSGTFITSGSTGLQPVSSSNKVQKLLRGGHLLILRDGHKYTATGTMIE